MPSDPQKDSQFELMLFLVEVKLLLVELKLHPIEVKLLLVELKLHPIEVKLLLVELKLHPIEVILNLQQHSYQDRTQFFPLRLKDLNLRLLAIFPALQSLFLKNVYP